MANERSLGLDLARTLAIFSVIGAHTTDFKIGAFGVQLFFVVSGYLLADFRSHFTSKNFLLHRFLRLAPLAWVSIFVFHFRFSSIAEIALNLLLIQSLFLNVNSFPGGWSISFEWLFSILNLLLVRLTKATIIFLTFTTILVQLGIHFYETKVSNWSSLILPIATIIANLGFFLCGNLIRRMNFRIRKPFLVLLVLITLPLISMHPPYNLSVLNILIVCLFLLCLDFRTKSNFISATLHFIGKRTYGIFLGHFVVLIGIGNIEYFRNIEAESGAMEQLIYLLTVGVGGVIIGFVSYKFLEKPVLNFSSRNLRKPNDLGAQIQ